MAEGSLLVLNSVAATGGKLFKAREIVENTGLTKQNVNYHLTKLVNKEVITKNEFGYVVIDKQALLNEFVSTTTRQEGLAKFEPAPHGMFVGKSVIEKWTNYLDFLMTATALDLPGAAEARRHFKEDLDHAFKQYKLLMHKVNNSKRTEYAALKRVESMRRGEWVKNYKDFLVHIVEVPDVNYDEVSSLLMNKLEDAELNYDE